MGEVYRAKDLRLKREVALKVLPAAVASDPERLARFQREAEVLACKRLFYHDGDAISAIDVDPTGPVLSSRRSVFGVPHDVRGRVDVMPDGEHAAFIRGGLMYSDLVVAQGALQRR